MTKIASYSSRDLIPQEEKLELKKQAKSLFIGVPKEITFQESRIAIVPDAVQLLVSRGHEVYIESNAGAGANFSDEQYSEAGAKIIYDTKEIYKADVILKVEPPTLDEIDLMKGRQSLISALQITTRSKSFIEKLAKKKINCLAYEFIQDDSGMMPLIRSMSEIAGNTSVLIASEYLSNVNLGKGLLFGGIAGVTPTEVVIIGAGTVGEFAARSALGLGASVKVFDNSLTKLRRLQNDINIRVFTSIIQPKVLEKALRRADVVIGALCSYDKRTPCVVSKQMVSQMKEGSVIIDVSIDQGGCFETSKITNHAKPTFNKYGVIHYCVPNIPSRVARTASYSMSNLLTPIILKAGDFGGLDNVIVSDVGLRQGVYICHGMVTNKMVGKWFKLDYKEIDLIIASI
ncbi:MAG: alanine dehydrogenase [Flavobacteriales bacterium]|nr:alanine dehydrogenase [Flavobacteriales bacterium]|tara:strand:+ start:1630 stop:2835 length:1206 start_codon:yes stop_codon:yes gene_type:complete